MAIPFYNPRNMNFILYEMLDVEKLTAYSYYSDHSRDNFDAIIDVAGRLATKYFYYHNQEADKNGPEVVDGRVKIIPEVKKALGAYADAGFFSAHHSIEFGGIQLPWVINQACLSIFQAANISTTGYPFLTIAAANLLAEFGSESQKTQYLFPMVDGKWYGTMALTEPQAGSSLSDVTTSAVKCADGHYLIKGNKMFISGGEHELSENIIHLVLARVKGAPAGVKGLSLFIVPRYLLNTDGSLGKHNDVALAGLIHKMGYRGTTSTALNFGENDCCIGYLIGEENKGLHYMFHMMNEARIGVGMGAAMLGYAGYLYSLDYARTRMQGRLLTNKDPKTTQVMLIEHADVRNMLLQQKAYVEGSFALGLYASMHVDLQRSSPDGEQKKKSGLLLDILTPIFKTCSSEFCMEANYLAIQILGGYGYTNDYPAEQYYRDNRINTIHEGTTGIQAIDLLGRKVLIPGTFSTLRDEIINTITQAEDRPVLKHWASDLGQNLKIVEETTAALKEVLEREGSEIYLANATIYLRMFGFIVFAWIWLQQALVATKKIDNGNASSSDIDFYMGKLQTCQYFYNWELPKSRHLSHLLKTVDRTCMDMKDTWF